MRASRGMGDIKPSKMPGKKIIQRKDDPQDVEVYAKGGKISNVSVSKAGTPSSVVKKLLTKPGSLKAADLFKKGGEVWDKPRPKDLGKSKKLSPEKKSAAKAMAKAAGRPYPNLVDNMRAARKK
jgi:hypothetical protein